MSTIYAKERNYSSRRYRSCTTYRRDIRTRISVIFTFYRWTIYFERDTWSQWTHSDARNNIIAVYFVRSVVYEIFRPWWYINNIIRQNISYVVIYKQYAEYFVALYATEYLIRGITSNITSRNISFVALYVEYFVRGDTQTILYCIWTFRGATSNIVSRNISFVASYTKYLVRPVTSSIVLRNIGVMYEIFRPWWYINNIVVRNISSHY